MSLTIKSGSMKEVSEIKTFYLNFSGKIFWRLFCLQFSVLKFSFKNKLKYKMPPKKDAKGGAKDKGGKAAAGGSDEKGD